MILIGGKAYELVKEHRNAWNYEVFRDRYSDVLERYDYIVGDWGYNQLRLRGFLRDTHPKATKETAISGLQDYLNEYCNFGCAYFILEKTAGNGQGNAQDETPQDETPRSEEAPRSEDTPQSEEAPDAETIMSISDKDYKQFDRHKFVPRERHADKDRPNGEQESGRDNRHQGRKHGDRSAERERPADSERGNERNRGNDRERPNDRSGRGEHDRNDNRAGERDKQHKERSGGQQRWNDRDRDRGRSDRHKQGDKVKAQEGGGKPRGGRP